MSIFPTKREWRSASSDIRDTLLYNELWVFLGLHEIRQRYRRSTLGPFWLTITTGINISAIGFISSNLFGTDMRSHLPFLSLSIVLWTMVSSTINEAGYCFIQAGGYIKQMRRPLFNYVMWTTWRNAIIFAHNVVIFGFVAVIFQVPIGWASLLAVPGLLLLAVNLIWIELLLGVLSTRFRDIPITVQSLLSIMFFVTPIFWKPEQLGSRQWIALYNPMTHLLDIVRLPFLDEVPSMFSYGMAAGCAVVGWGVALIFFARFRARIAYWL